jgi:hypothetical protein
MQSSPTSRDLLALRLKYLIIHRKRKRIKSCALDIRDTDDIYVIFTSVSCCDFNKYPMYVGVSKSFRIGRLQRELKMVQLSATMCSCIAIL